MDVLEELKLHHLVEMSEACRQLQKASDVNTFLHTSASKALRAPPYFRNSWTGLKMPEKMEPPAPIAKPPPELLVKPDQPARKAKPPPLGLQCPARPPPLGLQCPPRPPIDIQCPTEPRKIENSTNPPPPSWISDIVMLSCNAKKRVLRMVSPPK